MIGTLRPKECIDESEVRSGLQALLYDGVCAQVMGVFTGGAFLVAFALLLGASNVVIGLLAAIGPLTQILQIPAIFLVDRTGLRKALVVLNSFMSRLFWLVVAALPWIVPAEQRVPVLLLCLFLYFGLGTISGCAFNSWMRDFIPESIMGSYFGKRMAIATATGAVLTLLAGFGIEVGKRVLNDAHTPYSILFVLGGAAGLVGVYFLARIPEPKMAPHVPRRVLTVLAEPFREFGFRRLLMFLGAWNFAINLAAPFFVVYMITRLGIPLWFVLSLSVLSQIINVVFFRIWGRLADRFTSKSVLAVSGWMFILSIFLWPFLTMPEKHLLTIPLLIAIHVLAGVSTAGTSLCAGNIALKAAPQGKATAYLAANALVNGGAATVAPILAGLAADWFAKQELALSLRWASTVTAETVFDLSALSLKGLDFLFMIAVLFGIYAMHRLLAVREEGEVGEKIVLSQLYGEVRKAVRHVSNVAGLRQQYYFPFAKLEDVAQQTESAHTDSETDET
ncbi:MAG: MFS transporter [Phycisphaerales bacterium]|nr:MAG: MFS transporter [Phycisphaerales bacterium]